MANSSPLMIWVTDDNCEIAFVNKAYLEFFGVTTEQVPKLNWRNLVHPDNFRSYVEGFAQSTHDRTTFRSRARVRRADGQWRWVESYAAPFFSPSNEFLGMVGSSPDVTEQIKAEEQLRNSVRSKEELLAIVAHELRNALAPIIAAGDLLDPPSSERGLHARGVITRQVDQLTRLVDDLLDMSRLGAGKLSLHLELLDLGAVVTDSLELARRTIEQYGHQLIISLSDEPLIVRGDPMRLSQVAVNILTNAAKFTPHGGTIEIETRGADGNALVSIRDNGIGLRPEELEAAFSMFEQMPGSGDRTGLGIGLPLSKRLVEMHGGTIEVKSEGVGRGCEFIVRLPRALP